MIYRNTFGRSAPVLFEMEVVDSWQPILTGLANIFTPGQGHAYVEVLDSDADVSFDQKGPINHSSFFRKDKHIPAPTRTRSTWTEIEKLVDSGLAKNIGISNAQGSLIFNIHRYARIEPQVLQVEIHPYLTQEPLIKYSKLLGLAVTAYSSFGPQSYDEHGAHKNAVDLLEHDLVSSVASKNNKKSGPFGVIAFKTRVPPQRTAQRSSTM